MNEDTDSITNGRLLLIQHYTLKIKLGLLKTFGYNGQIFGSK